MHISLSSSTVPSTHSPHRWVQFQPQNIRKENIFQIPKNQHKGLQNIRKKPQTAESTEEDDLGELIITSIEGLGELAAGFEGEIVHEVVLPSKLTNAQMLL